MFTPTTTQNGTVLLDGVLCAHVWETLQPCVCRCLTVLSPTILFSSYEDFKKQYTPDQQRKIMGDYLEPVLQKSDAYNALAPHERDRLKDDLADKALDHLDRLAPEEYDALADTPLEKADRDAAAFLDKLAKGLIDLDDFDRLSDDAKASLLDGFLRDHPDYPYAFVLRFRDSHVSLTCVLLQLVLM